MLVTVEGIIIGMRDIGENNCFIDVLTDEYGVIEATAHGVKKLSSKNAGACSLFSMSKFCFAKTGTKYTLNSAEPIISFHGLSAEIERVSLAAYFAEVIKSTVSPEQEAKGITRFMAITLYETEKNRYPLMQIKTVFELRISAMLGFSPDLRACRVCICYEHESMYFDFAESCIVCGDCIEDYDTYGPPALSSIGNQDIYPLTPTVLYAMRYIVYSPVNKIYRFTVAKENLESLAQLTERYILEKLDCNFKSLDYYKSIIK